MDALDTVVVDVDGTLLDSNYHHTLAWSRAFAQVGEPVALWRVHRHIGMGGDQLVAAVSDDEIERRLGDRLRELWVDEYDKLIEETRLFEGAVDLLSALRARGLSIALASSGIGRHTEHTLDLLGSAELYDVATTADDAERSKPHPDLIETALSRVGGSRAACLVGDTVWDVQAAAALGIPTVGLLSGGYGRTELTSAGATVVYDDLVALGSALEETLTVCAQAVAEHQ